MNEKHSALPWVVGEANQFDNFESHIGVRSHDDWVVCEVQVDVDRLPGDANAAFIVRAVNSHHDLVEALKRCVTRMTAELPDPQDIDELYFALEILAKAEKP